MAKWPEIYAMLDRMPEISKSTNCGPVIDKALANPDAQRLPEWLREEQAADLAGMSARSVRRYKTVNPDGEKGKIRRRRQPVPHRKPVTVWNRDDILALGVLRRM
jgi:hypothetical protein